MRGVLDSENESVYIGWLGYLLRTASVWFCHPYFLLHDAECNDHATFRLDISPCRPSKLILLDTRLVCAVTGDSGVGEGGAQGPEITFGHPNRHGHWRGPNSFASRPTSGEIRAKFVRTAQPTSPLFSGGSGNVWLGSTEWKEETLE